MKIDLVTPEYVAWLERVPSNDIRYNQAVEQTDYLEGVLWSDPARRLDPHSNPEDFDLFGPGTAAFWRGLIEASGYVAILGNGTERTYPRVQIKASFNILAAFLTFLQEHHMRSGAKWAWDEDARYRFQAGSGVIRFTGRKAQEVCRALYPPDSRVGLESVRVAVDQIISWAPRS